MKYNDSLIKNVTKSLVNNSIYKIIIFIRLDLWEQQNNLLPQLMHYV